MNNSEYIFADNTTVPGDYVIILGCSIEGRAVYPADGVIIHSVGRAYKPEEKPHVELAIYKQRGRAALRAWDNAVIIDRDFMTSKYYSEDLSNKNKEATKRFKHAATYVNLPNAQSPYDVGRGR